LKEKYSAAEQALAKSQTELKIYKKIKGNGGSSGLGELED
jgi:hypothetical protein